MTRALLLLPIWLVVVGCTLGCGTPPVAYPSTEAERAGIERARYEASRYLNCEDVEIIPVAPREVCNAAGVCWLEPTSLGGELLARGCGQEMRFYCDDVPHIPQNRSLCLSELELSLVCREPL